MTNRTIKPVLLILSLFSCCMATAQQTSQQNRDAICKKCTDSAFIDINKGRLVACTYYAGSYWFRQQNEFVGLLHKNGLAWAVLDDDDHKYCYAKTMNEAIEQKFGKGFIEQLLAQADTIMLNNRGNKYFTYYLCDTWPSHPDREFSASEIYVQTSLPVKENRKTWISLEDHKKMFARYHPFIDLGFNIDTASNISGFYLANFNPELKSNKKYKKKLFDLGVQFIKEHPGWKPGIILGTKVNTYHIVRLEFENNTLKLQTAL